MAQRLQARGREVGSSLALAAILAAILAGCQQEKAPLPPLPNDARAAVHTLLQRWHGPLQNTLGHVVVEMRAGGAEGARTKIAMSDGRVRVDRPDRSVDLLQSKGAWRCRQDAPPTPLEADAKHALEDLRALIAGVYLLPLYGAKAIAQQGPAVFAIEAEDGTTWRLEIDPDAQLPKSMSGPAGAIEFESFFSTGVSELPARVRLGVLGTQHLTLIASDVLFESFVFHDPTASATAGGKRSLNTGSTLDRPTNEPALSDIDSTLFLAIEDPGDWETRASRIVAAGNALGEQGQFGAGLPFLYEEDGKAYIGLPFVPDEERGSPPFVPRAGQDLRQRPRHRAVTLYRKDQAFAAASAAAKSDVAAFAARHALQPSGPVRVLPFFNWGEATPTAEQLARMDVQVELPVTERTK